jgi:hypothetical protein
MASLWQLWVPFSQAFSEKKNNDNTIKLQLKEEFEDTKVAIRIRIS